MIIIGVDYGKARTGVAVCDKGEILASPVETVPSYNEEALLDRLCVIAKEKKAELIVLGLPKNMDGSEGFSAQGVRAFGEKLKERSGLPLDYIDERCTTVQAIGFLNSSDVRGKKRKAVVDTVAATIFLQDYIDRRRS